MHSHYPLYSLRYLLFYLLLLPTFASAQTSSTTQPALPAIPLSPTFHSTFLCEKRIANITTPLLSSGTLTAQTPDSLRLSTARPYTSDIILHHQQILAKSQHESSWSYKYQPSLTGFIATLSHFGQLARGNLAPVLSLYTITPAPTFSPPPLPNSPPSSSPAAWHSYLLTPTDSHLSQYVKSIHISINPTTNSLQFYQLTTPQSDTLRYWLLTPTHPATLPNNTFAPK